MKPRSTILPFRHAAERESADLSRDGTVRAFRHRRGVPRVCPACGRPDDLFHKLRAGRANLFGALLRALDVMITVGTPADEVLALADWPGEFARRRLGLTPPSAPARALPFDRAA